MSTTADAARLGREHGEAGESPFVTDGYAFRENDVMEALGETGATTEASHAHRVALLDAYCAAHTAAMLGMDAPAFRPMD
jgi:hypothetical protein